MVSTPRPARLLAALAAAAALAACRTELNTPDGALISCTSDTDCPAGMFCRQSLQRCVSSAGADQTPPQVVLDSVVITPLDVRAGVTVSLAFDTDEPLAGPPVVHLVSRTTRRPAELVSSDGTHHVYSATAVGDEAEGAADLIAQLVDPAGNLTRDAEVGDVWLDFTPPALVPASASVEVEEPPGSPLHEVAALGAGGTAFVAFTMDEPLAADPVVIAAGSPDLPLELLSRAGMTYFYGLALDGAARPREVRPLRISAVDVAGNPATALELGLSLTTDGTPPAAPTATSGADPVIERTRIPWGTAASPGVASHGVAGVAGAVEANATVVLYDGAGAGALEVGRALAGPDGAFEAALLADPPDVWAEAVDDAGNAGLRARVVDVAWVASLGGKVAGQDAENPHRLETRRWFLGTLEQPDAVEVSGVDLGVESDAHLVTTGGAASWFPVARTGGPGYRLLSAVVHDPGLGRTVLFGGRDSGMSIHADTWEWDGWRWTPVTVADPEGDGGPLPSLAWLAAYDGHTRGAVLLDQSTMWSWNGRSWREVEAGPLPTQRLEAVAAWDAGRRVLVAALGQGNEDTWEWNGLRWTRASATVAAALARRTVAAAAYDATAGRVILFGGRTQGGVPQGDTWAWDGAAWSAVGATGPAARANAGLAYDEVRRELVLFGGQGSTVLSDTWALRWSGSTPAWTQLTPADPEGDGDPAWSGGRLVWNANRRVVTYVSTPGETWDWNGTSWAKRAPTDPEGDGSPVGSENVPLAGRPGGAVSVLQDGSVFWTWNGSSWARHAPAGGPASVTQGCLVWDPASARMLLFGGWTGTSSDRTWALALGPGTWADVTPADPGASPSPRTRPRCALHEALGVPVLFGGNDPVSSYPLTIQLTDVWAWTGAAWTQVSIKTAGPTGYMGSGGNFAYDPERGRLVLHAPEPSGRGTVWELTLTANGLGGFDGAWTSVSPSDPEGDGYATMGRLAWEPGRGVMGIVEERLTPPAVWLWDPASTSWAHVPNANPLGLGGPDLTAPSVTSDPATGRIVAVANEPWTWDPGRTASPAHVLHVAYGEAGGPDPAACADGAGACPIREVRVRWAGGADDPASANGATLQAWTGGWTALATGTGTAGAPGVITFDSAALDARALGSLFSGPTRELVLALVPTGAAPLSGAQVRRVTTDAVEVVVRYRRP